MDGGEGRRLAFIVDPGVGHGVRCYAFQLMQISGTDITSNTAQHWELPEATTIQGSDSLSLVAGSGGYNFPIPAPRTLDLGRCLILFWPLSVCVFSRGNLHAISSLERVLY